MILLEMYILTAVTIAIVMVLISILLLRIAEHDLSQIRAHAHERIIH